MALYLGNNSITKAYLGGNEVSQMYQGTTSLLPTGPAGFPVTRGLRTVYDFSDTNSYPGTGTTVYDISGNGFDGSLHGSTTLTTDYGGGFGVGKQTNQGLWMNGNNCESSGELTLCFAWDPGVRPDPYAFGRMWSGTNRTTPDGGGSYNSVSLEIRSNNPAPAAQDWYQDQWGQSRVSTNIGATGGVQIIGNKMSKTGTTAGDWELYKNGSSIANGNSANADYKTFNDFLTLGNRGDWNGENVPGNYFMCHIFDTYLTDAEMTTWYNFYKSRFSLT